MEIRTATSLCRASSKASLHHGHQSTGLSACWRKQVLVEVPRRSAPKLALLARAGSDRRGAAPGDYGNNQSIPGRSGAFGGPSQSGISRRARGPFA